MKSNIISQMYFGRLYPSEEYNKIDLCSSTFLLDAGDFYRKKANENEREMLIKGIKLLAHSIKEIEEINEAERTWINLASSRALRMAVEEHRQKQNLDLGEPNIARIFDNEVSNILETRIAELEENRRKDDERKEKEHDKLTEELIKEREFNTLLREKKDMPVQNAEYTESKNKSEEIDNMQETENPLIFDDIFIKHFYIVFDDYLWEHTGIESMKNWFRVSPIGKPIFKEKMTTYFCYALGKIEGQILENHKPANLNKWIKPIINGCNYTDLRNRNHNNKKIEEINAKLDLIK
jgi:hypothetical protein